MTHGSVQGCARSRRGFTLLETAAVTAIVAILLILVTTTFNGVGDDVDQGDAESAVRAVVFTEQRLYQTETRFSDDPNELRSREGAFAYTDGGAPVPYPLGDLRLVYVKVADDGQSVLVASRFREQCTATTITAPKVSETQMLPCSASVVDALARWGS